MLGLIVLAIFIVGGLMWWNKHKCSVTCVNTEGYGQDASIRASSGWLAGSGMYGYDPITEFAEQIRMVNMHDNPQAQAIARQQLADMGIESSEIEGFCDPRPTYWDVNYYPRNFEYPQYPPIGNTIYSGSAFAPPNKAGPCCGM